MAAQFDPSRMLSPNGQSSWYSGTGIPTLATDGTFNVGDMIFNSSVTPGEPVFWACTATGSPGTWTTSGGAQTKNVTANYTATAADTLIVANSAGGVIAVTIPTPVGIPGKTFEISRVGANSVTVNAVSVYGGTTNVITLGATNSTVVLRSDGTSYVIVSQVGTVTLA